MGYLVKENKCLEETGKIQIIEVVFEKITGGVIPTQKMVNAPDGVTSDNSIVFPVAYRDGDGGANIWNSIKKDSTLSIDTVLGENSGKSYIVVNVLDTLDHNDLHIRILAVTR